MGQNGAVIGNLVNWNQNDVALGANNDLSLVTMKFRTNAVDLAAPLTFRMRVEAITNTTAIGAGVSGEAVADISGSIA